MRVIGEGSEMIGLSLFGICPTGLVGVLIWALVLIACFCLVLHRLKQAISSNAMFEFRLRAIKEDTRKIRRATEELRARVDSICRNLDGIDTVIRWHRRVRLSALQRLILAQSSGSPNGCEVIRLGEGCWRVNQCEIGMRYYTSDPSGRAEIKDLERLGLIRILNQDNLEIVFRLTPMGCDRRERIREVGFDLSDESLRFSPRSRKKREGCIRA